MSTHAASPRIWGPRAVLERACLARWLAGAGAECGFPAAQLLSAVSLVVAGRDQGGVPRPRQHCRALRPRGAQPVVRNSAAERGVAEILRQADHPSGLYPVQRLPARPLRLPVLFGRRRSHLRSHHPAQQGRPDHLGKRRRRLLALQSAQGQFDAAAGADVSAAAAIRADGAPAASQRPAVPAELPARQLARLSLLGYRAGSVVSPQANPALPGPARRQRISRSPRRIPDRKRPRRTTSSTSGILGTADKRGEPVEQRSLALENLGICDRQSNHSARSISGKACIFPLLGGHSISKLLLMMVAASRSPSTANATTRLPPRWRISPSGSSGPARRTPVSSVNSRLAALIASSPASISPFGMDQAPSSLPRQ